METAQQSRSSIREVIDRTFHFFKRYRDGWGSLERFPPLAVDWLYRCMIMHKYLDKDADRATWVEEHSELREALEFVGRRWNVACKWLAVVPRC